MKFRRQWLVVATAIVLVGAAVAGCGEEPKESFPDMTPPAGGKGGIRGHMHGGLTEAFVCSEEWEEVPMGPRRIDLGEEGAWVYMFDCPGSAWSANIDASEDDLFFLPGLEPGDYWLIGLGESVPLFYRFGKHGHRVAVNEGRWTNVESLEVKSAATVRFDFGGCSPGHYSRSFTAEALGPTNIARVRLLIDGEAFFDSGDISGQNLQAYEVEADTEVTTGTHTIEVRVEGTGGAEPYVEHSWVRSGPSSCGSGSGEPPSPEP
jgi:hypothetical protein